jgi:hypothetical protein
MLSHVNPIFGFVEEVKKLSNYPEITASDTAIFKPGNYDYKNHNPIWGNTYDPRLFEGFSNTFRKLIILDEPVSIKNIHPLMVKITTSEQYRILLKIYSNIQNYLGKNMNKVTQFSFELGGASIVEKTNVRSLLNYFFAATLQHSKPDAQRIIFEINFLTYGALTEMIRIMMIDIKKLLEHYSDNLQIFIGLKEKEPVGKF